MAENTLKIDLHLHTNVSDGTDTPEEILSNVRRAGLSYFSVTDHDAVKAAYTIQKELKESDPRFIPGVEFSCEDDKGKYHILGYVFDPRHEAINSLVERSHTIRMNKVTRRIDLLRDEFGICFPDFEVKNLLLLDNPGKPHIGNLMVKYGFAPTKEIAIKDFIDRVHMKNEHIRPEEAISSIKDAGGIPVLAHPFYGSGDELILGSDMEERLKYLTGFGIRGIEAFYSGFSSKLIRTGLELADRFDLYVTAGSDYHGTNKMVVLGDTGLAEVAKTPERLMMFLKNFN